MKSITVRLGDEVHRAVRLRSVSEGVPVEPMVRGWLEEYAKGGLAAGDGGSQRLSGPPEGPVGSQDARPSSAASPRCTREARHHINHSGKPCPECGYPAA